MLLAVEHAMIFDAELNYYNDKEVCCIPETTINIDFEIVGNCDTFRTLCDPSTTIEAINEIIDEKFMFTKLC